MMLTDEQKAQIRRLAFWAVDDQPWIPEGVAEGLLTSHAIEAATIAATRATEEISAQMVAAERGRLMELVCPSCGRSDGDCIYPAMRHDRTPWVTRAQFEHERREAERGGT